jgi:SAM-dependent methyltransferase
MVTAEDGMVRLSQAQSHLTLAMNTITDLHQRQVAHRRIWEKKEALRLLYRDFHKQLLDACPEGRILDIGSGIAHIKESRPDAISTDILRFPGIDLVADAHRMPFADSTFSAVVMLDVLHHLERPLDFLCEAGRVLRQGGKLALIEPAMTLLARPFYQHLHEEPVDMYADPYAPVLVNRKRDPFDANQAIPTLLFATAAARKRVERYVPSLHVRNVKWLSLLAYPMSGGFQEWSLIPARLVPYILALEQKVPESVRKRIAFRMMIVLERA